MLSNTSKYALRSIIYIGMKSSSDKLINVKTIASNLDVPMQFLSKILQVYVRRGILYSGKGPAGGFRFQMDPYEVSLYDIVKIIDGEDIFTSCIVGTHPCISVDNEQDKCPVHDEYAVIRRDIIDFFQRETIGNIVKNFDNRDNLFLKL